jgi:hypothetical protein
MITMLTMVTMMSTIWLHFGYSGTNVQVKNSPPAKQPATIGPGSLGFVGGYAWMIGVHNLQAFWPADTSRDLLAALLPPPVAQGAGQPGRLADAGPAGG